jgi:Zn-dependent protease with chaperone function
MKFKHKTFDHQVNHSTEREWVIFVRGGLGLIILVVITLITITLIVHLGVHHLQTMDFQESPIATESYPVVQRVFASLPKPDIPPYLTLKVAVMKEIDSNAFAYPNGTIVIFEGLLKTIKSENALAFVLAHEVGHYAHRDHFKTMLELGLYSILSSIVDGMMTIPSTAVQARFSQNTETAADLYALDVLYKRYGHVGGATEFFSTIHHNDFEGLALIASHPLSKKRIEVLRARIKEKQFPEKATILL